MMMEIPESKEKKYIYLKEQSRDLFISAGIEAEYAGKLVDTVTGDKSDDLLHSTKIPTAPKSRSDFRKIARWFKNGEDHDTRRHYDWGKIRETDEELLGRGLYRAREYVIAMRYMKG